LRVPHEIMRQKRLTPEEIAAQKPSEVPFLRLPERPSVFADRATRLMQLAPGHAMGDYLRFIARLAEVQQAALDDVTPVMLPAAEHLMQCREHGMPPLSYQTLRRDPVWHDMLRRMLRRLADEATGMQHQVIMRLEGERDDFYEAQASKLLAGQTLGLDHATAPLLGAALQVYWTHLVTTLGYDAFGRLDVPNVCPCCASRPTASIARIGQSAYRYLHCSLCAAEWHMVRIKCTNCDTTKGIHYLGIEGGSLAIKAECCDECGTYLKILYMEKDHQVEPAADDLATLTLDLLVAETGKASSGVNFMLIHGKADE
jgi:FdhE protein